MICDIAAAHRYGIVGLTGIFDIFAVGFCEQMADRSDGQRSEHSLELAFCFLLGHRVSLFWALSWIVTRRHLYLSPSFRAAKKTASGTPEAVRLEAEWAVSSSTNERRAFAFVSVGVIDGTDMAQQKVRCFRRHAASLEDEGRRVLHTGDP